MYLYFADHPELHQFCRLNLRISKSKGLYFNESTGVIRRVYDDLFYGELRSSLFFLSVEEKESLLSFLKERYPELFL